MVAGRIPLKGRLFYLVISIAMYSSGSKICQKKNFFCVCALGQCFQEDINVIIWIATSLPEGKHHLEENVDIPKVPL